MTDLDATDDRALSGGSSSASGALAMRSLGWTALEALTGVGLSFVTVLVIARLIGPEAFGQFALAWALVQLLLIAAGQLFGDSIVQRPGLRRSHVETAFWTSVGAGCVLATAAWVLATVGADPSRGGPAITTLVAVLCPVIVLESIASIPAAILKRKLRFRTLAMRTLAGRLVGSALALGLAFGGWGVWALVVQALAAAVVTTVCALATMERTPRLRWSIGRLRQLASVAAPTFAAGALYTVGNRIFTVLVGIVLGPVALGHYSLAARLIDTLYQLSLGIVGKVTLPLLARHGGDRTLIAADFRAATERTAAVIAPMFIGLAVTAPVLVPLVLGPDWGPAALVTQLLALSPVAAVVTFFQPMVFTAVGRAGLNLVAPAAAFATSIGLLFMLAPFGVLGAAAAWGLRLLPQLVINLALMRRVMGVSVAAQLRGVGSALIAGAAMAAVVVGLDAVFLTEAHPLVRLLAMAATGVAVYVAMLMLIAPRVPLGFLSLGRRLFNGGAQALTSAAGVRD